MPQTCVKMRKYRSKYRYVHRSSVGQIPLHVYIWLQHNMPAIPKGMVIHHINGNTFDNRISNLAMLTVTEHIRHHNGWKSIDGKTCKRCPECGQYKNAFTEFYWVQRRDRKCKTPGLYCKPCHTIVMRRWRERKQYAKRQNKIF